MELLEQCAPPSQSPVDDVYHTCGAGTYRLCMYIFTYICCSVSIPAHSSGPASDPTPTPTPTRARDAARPPKSVRSW